MNSKESGERERERETGAIDFLCFVCCTYEFLEDLVFNFFWKCFHYSV